MVQIKANATHVQVILYKHRQTQSKLNWEFKMVLLNFINKHTVAVQSLTPKHI